MREKSHAVAARAASIACRQHGVLARGQLLELGMSSATIARWTHAGHLHPIHRGVYALGHRRITQEGRWMAAVLACGEKAALSHGPAGQLGGFIDRRQRFALHVSVPAGSSPDPRGIVVHRPRSLERVDLTTRIGIPTTTPTRTIWDLATTSAPQPLRRAFERAEGTGRLDRARLAALLSASPSRKGAALIRQLLAERPLPLAEVRSWLEELLVLVCSEHRLPLPAIDVPLFGYTVDFLWPAARFVVEADGSDHLDPTQRDKDNERDFVLGKAGYLVRRYSYRAMGRERQVAGEVRGILAERLARQVS